MLWMVVAATSDFLISMLAAAMPVGAAAFVTFGCCRKRIKGRRFKSVWKYIVRDLLQNSRSESRRDGFIIYLPILATDHALL